MKHHHLQSLSEGESSHDHVQSPRLATLGKTLADINGILALQVSVEENLIGTLAVVAHHLHPPQVGGNASITEAESETEDTEIDHQGPLPRQEEAVMR